MLLDSKFNLRSHEFIWLKEENQASVVETERERKRKRRGEEEEEKRERVR